MVELDTVLSKLPVRNREVLIVEDQDERDIIDEILIVHDKYASDYDNIYKFFDQGNEYDTSECLWDFLKERMIPAALVPGILGLTYSFRHLPC